MQRQFYTQLRDFTIIYTYFLSVDRYVVGSRNDISFASDRICYLSHLTMSVIGGLFPLRLAALRAKEKFLIVW